ncbi:MAG: hypothetical protein N3G21_11435 [Candidatus Hydrogenedentes bacterium]|nr:hypothetical protein [Candidatus Hydrogenedentota bacterium]
MKLSFLISKLIVFSLIGAWCRGAEEKDFFLLGREDKVIQAQEEIYFNPPEPPSPEWEIYWRALRDTIINKSVSPDKWEKSVREYFSQNTYTLAHLQTWDVILQDRGEYSDELVLYSVIFHSGALVEEIKKPYPNVDSILFTSRWLFNFMDLIKESHRSKVVDIFEEQFKKVPLRIEELWKKLKLTFFSDSVNLEWTQVPPIFYETIIYLCLMFDAYFSHKEFLKYIILPEPLSTFYKESGILIFDGGILTENHYRSLLSIFTSFPPTIHRIRAVIVPESVGGISAIKLLIPQNYGVVIDIPFIPMEVMSNPDELPLRIGKQVAPEFSLQVVVQLLRATQWVQFRLRPELAMRRDRLLLSVNPRAYNYVRQTIPPSLLLSSPDELLPQTGYLWCLNTDKALQMANDLLRINQHFATDAFMLLADLLSEGRNVTLTFYMDENGILSVREAPVFRIPVDEGFPAVVGISPERFIPQPHTTLSEKSSIGRENLNEVTNITPNANPFNSGVEKSNREMQIFYPPEK